MVGLFEIIGLELCIEDGWIFIFGEVSECYGQYASVVIVIKTLLFQS